RRSAYSRGNRPGGCSMHARHWLVVVIVVVLAACGSSSSKAKPPNNATTTPADTSLGTGVTPTTVKVGVSLINFDCIKQFTHNIRNKRERYSQPSADNINNQGGGAGRQIVLDFHEACRITAGQASAQCTKFTDDDKDFAVIGLIYDTSGAAQV